MTDRRVFLSALMALSFWFGMEFGHLSTMDQIARNCVAQPGEKLVATHQDVNGVLCSFARETGKATKARKAS